MPILDGREQERRGILEIANLMVVAARTAPKSGGRDDILTAIVHGHEIEAIAADMEKIAAERNDPAWVKHAKIIKGADAIVLIGVRGTKSYVTNCGACGCKSCDDFTKVAKRSGQDFEGPNCIFKTLDLGSAVCSAAKIASILNADNRLYYRIGAVTRRLRYMPEATVIIGIPLSATGKNPNFDRELSL
ncbi:MAG: hypothetical protein A3J94_13180 [Syntrophus sp. RIFOXYC2_FULL_54_9]|nr:MAG: hypothetical protein A2X92_06725 [Syntrophus sp. GWC2_56_31]OHE32094.1 MAG: hypothetical protein A3J94_13180 [Syntrophus sp. RIFOXYC2_FULL_54_9]HBB15625.1 hypothetical protein [Syntrophus sp. (in: bacteria)]